MTYLFDMLKFVSLAECRKKLINADNYGYGLDMRRIAKGLPTKETTVQRHRESYDFWMDLFVYKTLRGEGYHPPLYLMEPTFEMEKALDWWQCYFSYSWQGAKQVKGENMPKLEPDSCVPRCANCYESFDLDKIPEPNENGELICKKCEER